jgi:hypothetical protein
MIYMTGNYPGASINDTRLLVQPSQGTSVTTYAENYLINGQVSLGLIPGNSYVCHSGTASWTACSQFKRYSANFGEAQVVDAYEYNCQGDSGGPVYKNNKALGIVSGGVDSAVLDVPTMLWGWQTVNCTSQGYRWTFYSIEDALINTGTTLIID